MIEWFTDNCTFPATTGFILAIVFIGLALSAGSKPLLKAGLLIAVLTAMLVTTEVLYVSDRESASNAVYKMAEAMQRNDFDYVYGCLGSERLVNRAKAELRDATCHSCFVTAMNGIEISDDRMNATVKFVAFAKASNTNFPNPVPIQRRVVLHMKKSGDKWVVEEFEQSDPREGLKL